MPASNAGIASLPDTMSQDDPWAWLNWAQQREPDTYAWRDLGRVEDSPAAYQWMLEKAGLWNPSYVSQSDADRAAADGAQLSASEGPNPYAGLTMRDARGPGYQRMTQLIDKDGKVVASDNPEAFDSYHEDTYRGAGSVLAGVLGAGYAAPLASAMGGGALGAAGAGAAIGAGTGQIATGTTAGTVRGGVVGGITGLAGHYLNGATGATGSLTDGVDPNAFDAGYNTGDINYDSGIDSLAGSPPQQLTPAAIDSMFNSPGYGANAAAEAVSGQESGINALDPDFRPGYVAPNAPTGSSPTGSGYQEQTVEVRPPSGPISNPTSTGPGVYVPSIPTTPQVPDIKVPDVPEYKMPDQAAPKTDLEKFWDWAKANPKLAMQLFGLGAAAFKGGGSGGGSGASGPSNGSQSGMTSTPAAPLNRHYVAPPAGYRPGFDPEWQYFQPGPASAGGTSTTQPVGTSGIASVANTPVFTSGSTIGSPSVNKPVTPGPNNNMDMNGQPLTPTFSGVGAGGPPPANVPQQAAPTYTPQQQALADAYRAHLGFADPTGSGVSTEDLLARLANEQRRFDLFGNDSNSLFKNNQAAYNAYKSGDAGAFTSALGPQQNNASAAYRYTGNAASAAAGQAEIDKLDAQKAAEVAATQPGGPMFGGVGSLPK